MNLKQFFCKHRWYKVGGANNMGNGTFKQHFRCSKCNKFITTLD